MSTKFTELTLEQRQEKVKRMIADNPNRIPIILQMDSSLKSEKLLKKRFLIPGNYKINNFLQTLKKDQNFKSDRALYFFTGATLIKQDKTFNDLYIKYKDEDGILYMRCTDVPTFG